MARLVQRSQRKPAEAVKCLPGDVEGLVLLHRNLVKVFAWLASRKVRVKIFAVGKGGEGQMTQSLISELAQRLGKSEEEVLRFFQTLWQVMPPSSETQLYFFRYLDERFLRLEDRYTTLRQEMHQQIEALRKEMQQGNEALRKEMQQGNANLMQQIEALRKEMQQREEDLRKEIQQTNDALRKEMQQGDANLLQQIEALRKEMQQGNEALKKEMQQGDANLMQQIEMLRKEMQHNDTLLRQELEALRRHVERVERWLFALTVPVLVSTLGILVLLFKPG